MNTFTVTAPSPGFNGQSCGVTFKGGVGQVTDADKEGRAAIEYFRRRGYVLVREGDEEPEPSTPAEPGAKSPEQPPFDPSQHNADEVIAYLDSLGTDDSDAVAEVERVIAAERDGKNRKTITEKGPAA